MSRRRENNTALYIALGAAVVLLVAAVVSMKVLLKPPPAPPAVATPAAGAGGAEPLGRAPLLFQEELRADASRFGVGEVDLEQLAAPLRRSVEIAEPRPLRVGEIVDTPTLRLRLRVESRDAQGERGGFRADHLILTIENRTDGPIAYRVDTRFEHPERCTSRGVLVHNAIALPARGRVERSECIMHRGAQATITLAETISLPPIGYFYVSQLVPTQIGLDNRTSDGHAAPRPLATCNLPYWREFATWGLGWADLVDFFARHNCERHGPYKDYRFRTEPGPLPAQR